MFERILPSLVKPYKLARKNATLRGHLPLSAFTNLLLAVPEEHHKVEIYVEFSSAAGDTAVVKGTVGADVPFRCQRCLEPVDIRLDAEVNLTVAVEETENIPDGFELFVCAEEQMPLVDLLEQELILAAPAVPCHADCDVTMEFPVSEVIEPVEVDTKVNPFSGLADLLATTTSKPSK